MTSCSNCGSYAINHHLHGRDGSDPHLCDVCYWCARAVGPDMLVLDRSEAKRLIKRAGSKKYKGIAGDEYYVLFDVVNVLKKALKKKHGSGS